jgi:hypothetical protein
MSADTLAAPGSAPPPSQGLSQIERVIDTFVAPSKTFEDIRRSSSWWLPFLIMLLGSLAVGYSVQKEVTFERAYMNSLRANPTAADRINNLEPEQKARALALSATITKSVTYGFPVMMAIVTALYSLILWAAFNFGLGAQTTFWQVYAVSWYAFLPYILRSVLTVFTLHYGGNAEAYDYNNPVGTNLAYFMPDLGPALRALLTSLDAIRIWSIGLQVAGMAIIAKKSVGQSAFIVIGLSVIFTLITVGIAAAFS